MFVLGISCRERRFLAHPRFHINSTALDKMKRQRFALFLVHRCQIIGSELGAQQAEQGQEPSFNTAMRRGSEQNQVAAFVGGKIVEEFEPLLLAPANAGEGCSSVCFIDDDKLGRVREEVGAMSIGLCVVDTHDDVPVEVAKDAVLGGGKVPFELVDGARAHDCGVDPELLPQLLDRKSVV